MGKKVIKLKESDIVKLIKKVIEEQPVPNTNPVKPNPWDIPSRFSPEKKQPEQQKPNTELLKLIGFKCLKQGMIEITIGRCSTVDRGCYTFVYPPSKYPPSGVQMSESIIGKEPQETWTIDCNSLKKNIVYSNQGFNAMCPELAKYLLYKAQCCGGGGEEGGCTTIRCKVESEVNKCTKKKYNWKEVKDAFELEFPGGAPKGSSERNQQLWKEWKKGWRPKCEQSPVPKDGDDKIDQDKYAF